MAGLRTTAENDLSFILEDGAMGFGWPIVLIDPAGVEYSFTGFSNDISQVIDPDTGQVVSGRIASVALRISSIYAEGLTLPTGEADAAFKPWLTRFDSVNGETITFKVIESDPDRSIGVIVLMLELYDT